MCSHISGIRLFSISFALCVCHTWMREDEDWPYIMIWRNVCSWLLVVKVLHSVLYHFLSLAASPQHTGHNVIKALSLVLLNYYPNLIWLLLATGRGIMLGQIERWSVIYLPAAAHFYVSWLHAQHPDDELVLWLVWWPKREMCFSRKRRRERVNKTKLLGLYFTSIWLYVYVCVRVEPLVCINI